MEYKKHRYRVGKTEGKGDRNSQNRVSADGKKAVELLCCEGGFHRKPPRHLKHAQSDPVLTRMTYLTRLTKPTARAPSGYIYALLAGYKDTET